MGQNPGGRDGGTMRIQQFLAFLNQVGFRQSDVVGRKLSHAFDADKNGFIDLPEFSSVISLMCSGDNDEKVDFIFSLIDVDRDGSVSASEVSIFIEGMFSLTTDVVSPPFSH
jgi:Ca2+-binding EF-hand superfamily protein